MGAVLPRTVFQKPMVSPSGDRALPRSWPSWSSRCSSEGWVAVRVFSDAPLIAGAMKNAFIDWAWRRSRLGIAAISPVIFCRADASADGFWVR